MAHAAKDVKVNAFVGDHVRGGKTQLWKKAVGIILSTSYSAQVLTSSKRKHWEARSSHKTEETDSEAHSNRRGSREQGPMEKQA